MTDGELIRLRNCVTALEANGAELLTRAEQAEARLEHALDELSSLRDHRARWETEKARADKAEKRKQWAIDQADKQFRGRCEAELELEQFKRGGKELGKIIDFLAELIKDAYLRGADDPIGALHMLGNYLAELLEGEGGLPADDHNRVYRALEDQRAERDALKAAVERTKEIHHRSMFPATSGEDRGKHYCPACTYSDDGWTAYAVWPCATAAALDAPQRPEDARTGVSAGVEASGGAGEAQEG